MIQGWPRAGSSDPALSPFQISVFPWIPGPGRLATEIKTKPEFLPGKLWGHWWSVSVCLSVAPAIIIRHTSLPSHLWVSRLPASCSPHWGGWGSHFLAHLPCLLSILLDPAFPSPGKTPRGSGDQEDGDKPPGYLCPLTLASRNVLVRQHHPATGEAVSC